MAKNNSKQTGAANQAGGGIRPAQNKQYPKAVVAPTPASKASKGFGPTIHVWLAGGVALLTWLFLHTCTNNLFTNWDDPGYIKNNQYIKDISPEGLKHIFSVPIMGNYHPLTILTYAIEYSYVKLDPWLYHFDSLIFHILTTLLVYWFVALLTRRPIAAAIAALLFGLHPMHMESVAWLAGRKDVVYGMFYMAACVIWVYYARAANNRRLIWYGLTLVLFACSLLAKPVAVVLPLTLFLIDYFEGRKLINKNNLQGEMEKKQLFQMGPWNLMLIVEKLPLFALSILAGLRSLQDQKTFRALDIDSPAAYNFMERIALGCYAFITYLWKAVAPVRLCNFYPYPEKVNNALPVFYYIYPIATIAIATAVWFFGRKNKVVVFGSLFFLVNIILLLQFLPVGGAIIADRYSYIAYLGLFFMAGWAVSGLLEAGKKKDLGYAVLGATLAYTLVLGYLANERCKVWYDTVTLWRDEIEKEPHDAPNAWNNLGFEYFNRFNDVANQAEKKVYYDSSFYFLNEAIRLQPTFVDPYISLGELKRSVNNFPEAKKDYYKALSLKTTDESANAYLGLAIVYAISRNFDSSGYCFKMAIKLQPQFPEAHSNYGNFFDMTGKPDSALAHYALAIAQNPDMYAPHLNRGRLLYRLGRFDQALQDFNTALQLLPENNGEVYYARSFIWLQKGDKGKALQDVQKAQEEGFTNINANYVQSLKTR